MNFTFAGSCSAGTEDPLKNRAPIDIPSHAEWVESRITALLGAIVSSWENKHSVCEEHLNELNEALEQNNWLH